MYVVLLHNMLLPHVTKITVTDSGGYVDFELCISIFLVVHFAE